MSSNPSDIWSPPQGTTTYTDTFSPSRYSYSSHSGSQRLSSDGDDSARHVRRLAVSPSPSQRDDVDDDDDMYTEGNSIDEVDNALSNLDDEFDDAEQAVSEWSHGSYSSAGPTFSSATGTFTYSGTYTGSPSFVSLPTFSPRSPVPQTNPRLSRISEKTEESRQQGTRPPSTAFSASNATRPTNATPETLRRSAALGGIAPSHSRSSTDPSSDRTLPPPGRLSELRAVFESQGTTTSHSRATSSPAYRSSSPMFGTGPTTSTGYSQGTNTGYTQGTTSYGYSSRPSSPTKSGSSSGSHTNTGVERSLLSPPPTRTSSGFRSTPSRTEGDYTPSYTATPSNFSRPTNTWTNPRSATQTDAYTTPVSNSKGYTDSDTYTQTSVTPTSGFQRTQGSPRSPLASVRNVIALWKERTPAGPRGERSAAGSASSASPPLPTHSENDGLYGVRRRVEGARARLRESRQVSNPNITPTRHGSGDAGDTSSITSRRSRRSGVFPPGFDMNELTAIAQSSDPPLHIGLLWYLNVHASPPYRWQRCQALLYPHMLLLSWLAPGGGRGIVALDLLNCTSVESALSPTQEGARDDVGTIAARQQSDDVNGQRLQDILVPFHMMYADGVERLAAESLLERRKWVNRLWEAVNRPVAVPDSVSVTRSPTGSIRTILSMDSSDSRVSSGSRSTVFVPPLSTLPDISDFHSSTSGLSRQSSLLSSYHAGTVDDTVIQNQEYVYRGDPRAIQRRSSRRRSGSMTDLDEEFKSVVHRARGVSGMLGGSPVTVSSGSSLGKNIFVTPPPSLTRSFERTRSESSEDQFFSGSEGRRSNSSSTYFSPGSSTAFRTTALESASASAFTPATTDTNLAPSTFNSTFRLTDSSTYRSGDSEVSLGFTDSPSTLSRAREIRRRTVATTNTARSYTSGYLTEGSQTERDDDDTSSRRSRTPTESNTYTPDSRDSRDNRSLSGHSGSDAGSYLHSRSQTPTGSYTSSYVGSDRTRSSRTDSYTGSGTGSYTGTRSGTGSGSYTHSGSYTPGSGSFSLQTGQSPIPVSSDIGGFTPISSSETGYDVCTSSDFTELTRPTLTTTNSLSVTPVRQPVEVPAEAVSDVASEKYLTASLASTEFDTAPALSSRPSVSSFKSFETIPSLPGSDYDTASSGSLGYRTSSEPGMETEYRTASEPSVISLGSDYITCEVCPTIPSEASSPTLSSLHLDSEPDIAPSIIDIPARLPIIPTPASTIFSLPPEDVPLPDSLPALPSRPLPLSLTPSPRFLSPLPRSYSPPRRESPLPVSLSPSPRLLSPLPVLPPSSASSTISLSPSSVPLPPSTTATPVPRASPVFSLSGSVTPRAESPPLPPLPVEPEPLPSPSASPSLPSHHSLSRDRSPAPSSLTPSLSATPSPLEASLDYGDAETPSSLQMPTSSDVWSDHDSDDEPSEEDTISLSRLPSLPESTLGSTSIHTPTSLLVSSASNASALPPSTHIMSEPQPRPRVQTPLTVSSTVGLTTLTQTSSSIPLSPQPWAAYTDISYDSSILHPSPSTRSFSLQDGPDFLAETSFLRPTGSASSADRMSTIPPSPMTMTPATPLPSLTPIPMLPQSLSSLTDAETPSSLDWISESSSSLGRTLSTSSASSSLSQSSLSSSVLDSGSELGEFEMPEADVAVPLSEIATEPSLLSTVYEPRMMTPIPPSEVHVTPAVSAVSGTVSTPEGSGATDQSSLRTVQSRSSVVTERDLGLDLDRLADELQGYDHARAQENQALTANVQALRDELKDLTEFLQRSPTPSSPSVVMVQRGPSPRRVTAVTEGVQASLSIEPVIEMHRDTPVAMTPIVPFPVPMASNLLHPLGTRNLEDLPVMGEGALATVMRNISIASSTMSRDSHLSSHHSDDDIWDEQEIESELTPRWSIDEEEEEEEDTETDDSTDSSTMEESTTLSESSSPHTPSAVHSDAVTITQPTGPDILQDSLAAIQDKLRALEDGQGFTHGLIKELKDRPSTAPTVPLDPRPELVERLDRIEDLIHNVLEQSRMQPPVPAPAMPIPSPAPAPSEYPVEPSTETDYVRAATDIMESLSDTSSLGRLGSILRHLPAESSEPYMPSPLRPQAGPSIAERLTDILSSQMRMDDINVEPPPRLVPFVYTPAERGQRPRSASPSSIDLPTRSRSVPVYAPVVIPPLNIRPIGRPEQVRQYANRSARPEAPISRPRTGEPQQEQQQSHPQPRPPQQVQHHSVLPDRIHTQGPPPRPIFQDVRDGRRPETAPASGRSHQPWYKPKDSGRHDHRPGASRPSGAPGPPGGPGGPSQGGSQLPDLPQPASRADTIRYMPMPPGPVNVQLPPLFDSLMEILRENRLAQLATVEQQRELMRYMGELNGWLGRDVQDRRTELGGVLARVDQLSQELRSLRNQRAGQRSPTTTSTDDSGPTIYNIPGMSMPVPNIPGQHLMPGMPPRTFQEYAPGGVIPPVIPDPANYRPTPMVHSGGPVIPTPQPQPTYIIQQPGMTGPGRIPTDGFPYSASGPGPGLQHLRPSRPASQATTAFIPEYQNDVESVASTGPPRSRPTTPALPVLAQGQLPPDIIAIPPSASSSEDMSTRPSTRRRTPPGHTPSRPSSRQSRHDQHTPGRTRTPSDESYDRRRRRRHSGSRHRRSRSDSYSPSGRSGRSYSRHPRPGLQVANPSEGANTHMAPQMQQPPTVIYAPPPTVHVVSPSAPSRRSSPRSERSRYDGDHHHSLSPHPQQPTVIIQQPPHNPQMQPGQPMIIQMPPSPGQHHQGPSMVPYAPSHMSESPMHMPMTGMPMSHQGIPMSHQGIPMSGVPMTGMPMTGVPMTGMPMTGVPMTMGPGGPIIIRSDSPHSSRSRSRRRSSGSRRRHTPPPPPPQQPIIIGDTSRRRSRSRSRSHSRSPSRHHHSSYAPPPMSQQPVILQPQMPMMNPGPIIMPQGSPPRRRSRSRSHSPRRHSPDRVILQQPQLPTFLPSAPTMQPPQQPTVLLQGGTPAMGMMPGVPIMPGMSMMTPTLMRQRSRSSSRGRHHRTPQPIQQQPIIIPPAPIPTTHGGRRSRSPDYHRRHRRSRDPYDSRSPERGQHRRSSSPRRSASRRSRTPPRTHTPSHPQTAYAPSRPMTGMPMTGVPMTGMPMVPGPMSRYPTQRSISPRRRSPTRVEVVRDPRSHRSPDRGRYSPERERRRYSPEGHRRSPEAGARRHSPERGARRHSPERGARRHSPERGARRHSPERGARRYSPERDARRYSPERGARRYSPERGARRYSPERGARRYSPERGAPRYTQGRLSPERDRGHSSRPTGSRYRSPDRSGPRYISSRGRGDTRSPQSRDRHGDRHARSYSPVRSRTPSPRRPRRSRTGSPTYGHRSRSPTPTGTSGRPPTGYSPSYHNDERDSPPYRITVPSRHDSTRRTGLSDPHRPPTVVPFYPDASRPPTERPLSVSESHADYDPHSPVPHIAIVPGSSRPASPAFTARTEQEPIHAIPIPARMGTPVSGAAPSRPASTQPAASPIAFGNVGGMGGRPTSAARRQASTSSQGTLTAPPSAPRTSAAPIAHIAPTPFAFGEADAARAQLDELSNTAHRLQETADAVAEAENTREAIFQDQELKRQQVFEERERQRQAELDARLEAALGRLPLPSTLDIPQIESRPASIHSIGDEMADKVSIADSIRLASRAASIHKEELLQIVSEEREDAAEARRESEALQKQNLDELKESHSRLIGEKDNRIRELEEELAKLRGDFEADKQQRTMQEQETRDQDQQHSVEQYQNLHQQLGEVTELVSGQRSCCEEIRQMMESQMQEKENRRLEKSAHMVELTDMIRTIQKEMDDDRQRRDVEHMEVQTNLQTTINRLASQNDELRQLLSELSQEWRDECQRHHEETIEAVKATSNLQVPFNVQGYLDEFSRALASEVRLLLGEVGRIREERRALQHEISDLLSMKSKYGPGGEYEPDWRPPGAAATGAPPPEDIPPPPPAEMPHVGTAWRSINPKKTKKKKAAQPPPQPTASTSFPQAQHYPYARPGMIDPELRSQVRSFNQWIPDPSNQITPPPQPPTTLLAQERSQHIRGPFGTPSISDEGMY